MLGCAAYEGGGALSGPLELLDEAVHAAWLGEVPGRCAGDAREMRGR